jgi:6-phosphogluconate dehydrogenase (decarboxylating)
MSKEEAIRLLKESGAINWPGGPAWSIRVDDAERLVALARAPQAGWVMVPKEPTDAMIQAMQASMYDDGPVKRGHIEYALWEQVYGDLLAAASQAQPEPPAGWVMVPKEPTEEMIEAGWIDKEDVSPREIWWAMLAAAPNAQEE